ncbi:hypothetical protein N9499_01515 [Octadecabacter sp.]|nr:hypothetical protein [Octadecabacter sp.]
MMVAILLLAMALPYLTILFLNRTNVLIWWVYFFAVAGKAQILVIVPIILAHNNLSENLNYYYLLLTIYYIFISIIIIIIFRLFRSDRTAKNFAGQFNSYGSTVIVGLLTIICFSILLLNSNFIFFFDPRKGYQYYREGVGLFWALYVTGLSAAFYFLCIRRKISLLKVLLFCYLFYLTGSKQLVLIVCIYSYISYYVHFGVINKNVTLFLGVASVVLFLILFGQFGAEQGLIMRLTQYFDFLTNASRVFDDYAHNRLDFQFGNIWVSSFWSYVPRIVYPDKPFVYGATYVLEMYYPGMAETGHTPSFGPLTTEFVDFGWFAPIVLALTDLNTLVKIFGLVILMKGRIFDTHPLIQFVVILSITPAFGFHIPTPITFILAAFTVTMLITKRGSFRL